MAINKLISTCVIISCTKGEMGTYLSFYHKNYIASVIIHAYYNILFNLAQPRAGYAISLILNKIFIFKLMIALFRKIQYNKFFIDLLNKHVCALYLLGFISQY